MKIEAVTERLGENMELARKESEWRNNKAKIAALVALENSKTRKRLDGGCAEALKYQPQGTCHGLDKCSAIIRASSVEKTCDEESTVTV